MAHGYLVLSAAAGLFVDPDPGPVLANFGLERLRFVKPVYLGDSIGVRLTVKSKTIRPDGSGEVTWDVGVTNTDGELVASYDLLTINARRDRLSRISRRRRHLGGTHPVQQPAVLVGPLAPGLVPAAGPAVAAGHNVPQQVRAAIRSDRPQPGDPLGRFDVQHPGVVQAGHRQDRRVGRSATLSYGA